MSTVIPVQVGLTSTLILVVIAAQVGAAGPMAWVAVVGGGLAVGIGWARSPRLPNGGGPM